MNAEHEFAEPRELIAVAGHGETRAAGQRPIPMVLFDAGDCPQLADLIDTGTIGDHKSHERVRRIGTYETYAIDIDVPDEDAPLAVTLAGVPRETIRAAMADGPNQGRLTVTSVQAAVAADQDEECRCLLLLLRATDEARERGMETTR